MRMAGSRFDREVSAVSTAAELRAARRACERRLSSHHRAAIMTNGGKQHTRPWLGLNKGDYVKALLLLIPILLLSGCGITETSSGNYVPASTTQSGGGSSDGSSGGSGSSSPPPAGTINPAGIWNITDTVNGKPVSEVALIASGNYYSLAAADEFGCGDVTGGTYTIEGSLFAGSGVIALLNNCTAPGGQDYLSYTLNGYMTGSDLNLSYDVGGTLVPTLGATLNPLYNEPSSLAKLVGNWDDAGSTLTVDPDGTFFEQTASGCVVNGAYTIIDPTHNLYGVSFEITNCSSSIAGIAFTGLGYLDDSNPNAWHFLEDASGPDPANGGAIVVVFDGISPQ
jgi:hypothetical protein